MRTVLPATLILILASFFAGCTSYWYQEGKSFEECGRDIQQCRSEMKKYSDKAQYSLGVYELRFEGDCMKQKGYRLVKERDLPLRLKRQGPNASIGEKHGAAGAIE